MATDSSVYDSYTLAGMNAAQGLLNKSTAAYPTYTPSQAQSPAQASYMQYTPTAPMAQLNAPNYEIKAQPAQAWNQWQPQQGLMGGDYDKLQNAIATPGAAAATSAYNQGTLNLADAMGGRGLYGSSIAQNQQREALDKVYQQNMANNAANAAVQRYGMQQADIQQLQGLMSTQNTQQNAYNQAARSQDLTQENQMNQFNAQNMATGIDQNKSAATFNLANAENQNTFNANKLNWDQTQAQNQINWQNNQGYEKYLYDQAANAYANQSDEALYNRALALGGLGNTSSTAASNYQLAQQQLSAQQQAAANANSSANTASYLGAAGLLGSAAMKYFA